MERSYIEGLIKAKSIAKGLADKHQTIAEDAFNRLKEEFYPIPYNEHTEEQKEQRRTLQNVNLAECGKAIVMYDLINELWEEIFKAETELRNAV